MESTLDCSAGWVSTVLTIETIGRTQKTSVTRNEHVIMKSIVIIVS